MLRKTTLVIAAALSLGACSKNKKQAVTIPVETVKRETIVVTAEATGVVEPINVIEVKSKSSGQIVAMPVEIGSFVKAGDLLVQLDTRDTRNAYAQAKADLDAALIKLRVSKTARDRAAQLYKERIITSAENEAAEVDYANSQATVLRNRAALDLRAQGLEEATVRAPVAGTVIEKPVALGQVIASGTGTAGGGTTILRMADLTKIRVRALVNETDIGKVRPGLPTTVTVDAYPDRPFMGTVEKIEPQATIQQSVTMFPVLISIDNVGGLLMPGMNGEVSIETERRDNTLAVSNDAVRSPQEAASVASMLGLNPDSVRAQLASARGSFGRNGNGQGGQATQASQGNTPGAQSAQQGGQRGFNMPEVTDAQCKAVTDSMAKHPDVQKKLADLRAQMQAGTLDRQEMQAQSQALYKSAGLDAQVARACNFRQRGGQAGGQAGAQAGQSGQGAPGGAPGGAFGQRGGRRGMVFTVKAGKYTPKMVRLGVSNYDVSEVVSGLNEGDSVAILNVAAMQARQQEQLDQVRNRGGVPGLQRQNTNQGGGAGAARGGGQRGGN
ncbi:MAG TPA: efflux RND transporter periplasmic adaptor subunit [Gemmatimonadaceae bacterium]|nr:efflux RND transporter periplasmic adaptor subunit [Gemmatimonadaceae bacterium]